MPEQFLHGVEVVEIDYGPRSIRTVRSSVIGIIGTAPDADATAFPLNTPVLIAGRRTEAAKLDTTGDGKGTLPTALDAIFDQIGAVVVVIRVDEGANDAATMTNIIGGVDANTGQYEGVHALLGSKSAIGFTPRILLAPGFTHQQEEDSENPGTFFKNPVVAELEGLAPRLRAIVLVDGPNTNDADAIGMMKDLGARCYMVDPWVKVFRNGVYVNEPPSARVAGLIAKIDNDKGFWWSPSNQAIMGISGTARPVDFALGDANCRANLLNEKNVSTIINEGGFRLWGNRTGSIDPKWAFLSVRRTADMINESLLQAHLWAVDRNITKTYMEDVVEGVNAYLRHLMNVGAILGGTCWADEELNSPDQIAAGKVYFDFDFTPPAPAEHVTFRSRMVNDYFEEIF
ncbi:phage tail sheath C-terminal domain-containing protein [Maridesulfovibrio ferrireducens]|uniref:phage tail sheath C-terminal domain-containing protein n=1 Tax=Maridesulfovibrio ferrireducens TaxID=246191 RepID=UPI001A31D8AD|nr:phage tail sheath C-terminal domain-containing protein [Maridesulfovibrio ferrireducens]MBI9110120.1 phage tail sheath subtilisin-like domain-containing protein [Maridesulfovibrio ferrireducens]